MSTDQNLIRHLREKVADLLAQQRHNDATTGIPPMSPEDERQLAHALTGPQSQHRDSRSQHRDSRSHRRRRRSRLRPRKPAPPEQHSHQHQHDGSRRRAVSTRTDHISSS